MEEEVEKRVVVRIIDAAETKSHELPKSKMSGTNLIRFINEQCFCPQTHHPSC